MNSPERGGRAAVPDPDKGKPVARRGRKAKGLTQTAWLPKVKAMKKLAVSTVLALSILMFSAVPAQAALRMSVKTQAHSAGHVVFSAKASRPSRVRITVYKGHKVVRTLKARKSGRVYKVTWNQRDAHGHKLAAGAYAYKAVATARSARKTVRGKVRVARAADHLLRLPRSRLPRLPRLQHLPRSPRPP